ncbi:MAG: glycoside hydrolase family 2 protein [Eubacteriales bacterium]
MKNQSLAGIWDFYPDIEAHYTDIKASKCLCVHRADISEGTEFYADLHIDEIAQMRLSKLLIYIIVGLNAVPCNGDAALLLYASVNGGKPSRLDISSFSDGKTHRAELPLRFADLRNGINHIRISSNTAASVRIDSDSRPAVYIRYYSIDMADWQDMNVPGVWNGHFEFSACQTKNLLVTLNSCEPVIHDLTPYIGKTGLIYVDIPSGTVQNGLNSVILDSSFISNGNMSDESFDLIHKSAAGKCFVSHDLDTWEPLNDRSLCIRIELKNKVNGEWESFGDDSGDTYASCVIGLYKQNNMTYYQRADITLPSPDNYIDARVAIFAHVGSAVGSVALSSLDYNGAGWYRKKIALPQNTKCTDTWLHFTAVDYKAEIWLNQTHLGSHIGGYTPFAFNMDYADGNINYSSENILTVRVTNQAIKQTADGEAIMIKETNAGFNQDSIGLNYAGIWQDVFITERGKVKIDDIFANPDITNSQVYTFITVTNNSDSCNEFLLKVTVSGDGKEDATALLENIIFAGRATQNLMLPIVLDDVRLWSPGDPYLYTVSAEIIIGGVLHDNFSVNFGMRSISAEGAKLKFNGKNIFLTGMLDWMTDYNTISPTPSEARVEKQIIDLKAAGYNSVKFCLICPPDYVLDIYDRMGMYVYIEYPIWNPVQTEAFLERSRFDIIEMVKKDRNHPSVILTDFNCEMPDYTPALRSLMEYLINTAYKTAPNRLYLDNSSCGVEEFGDFRACHPYYEATNFHDVVDMWANLRNGSEKKYPIIFGEYADTDTIRDTEAVFNANGGTEPWWWSYYGMTNPLKVLKSSGYSNQDIKTLISASYKYAAEAKCYYIEQSKRHNEMAGLYITQINDVNSTQPGIYDEMGNLKYDVSDYYGTCSESSLILDRSSHNYYNGTVVMFGAEISHYNGADIQNGRLIWELNGSDTNLNGVVSENISLKNGDYYKIGCFELILPTGNETHKYKLNLNLKDMNGFFTENSWNIWTYPTEKYTGTEIRIHIKNEDKNTLIDQYNFLPFHQNEKTPKLIITTAVDDTIRTYLNEGGRIILLGDDNSFIPVSRNVTFNTWAMPYIPETSHPIMAKLHCEGYGLTQFFDIAANSAMDYLKIPDTNPISVITRINQRSCSLSSYLCEYSALNGKILQCTLNLGNEKQNNVIGEFLFDEMIRYMLID